MVSESILSFTMERRKEKIGNSNQRVKLVYGVVGLVSEQDYDIH